MTDLESLTRRLYRRIEWQRVPDYVTREDLSQFIADAIRHLYVMTGRSNVFTEDLFTYNDDLVMEFKPDLQLDEQEYVLVCAEIDFYAKVQSEVSELTSYTTDAMAVSHGDKPFANLQQMLEDLRRTKAQIWHKMSRYHLPG